MDPYFGDNGMSEGAWGSTFGIPRMAISVSSAFGISPTSSTCVEGPFIGFWCLARFQGLVP